MLSNMISKFASLIILFIIFYQPVAADPAGVGPPSLDLSKKQMAKLGRNAARFWSYGLEFAGDLCAPFKEKRFTDVAGGLGYELDFLKSISDQFALRFTYGKSGLHADDEFDHLAMAPETPPEPYYYQITQWRSNLDATRYFISAQYNALPLNLKLTTVRFYIFGGVGVVNHKTTLHETVFNLIDSTYTHYVNDDSINKFANTLGGGVILMFTRYTGIDISIAFDLVHAGEQPMIMSPHSGSHYRAYNYGGTSNFKIGLVALL